MSSEIRVNSMNDGYEGSVLTSAAPLSSLTSASTSASCPAPIRDRDVIVLGHGSGGRLSADLIEHLVLPALNNPILAQLDDQAILALGDSERSLRSSSSSSSSSSLSSSSSTRKLPTRIALTTDSYVVSPIFFPGGSIGQLAVNGTINDLAVGGARPIALSLAFILEEGFPIEHLKRVIAAVRTAADFAEVPIVTGDTKVVPHGKGDGIFINTSGVGVVREGIDLGSARIAPGDAILLSGAVGDHGVAVLACRQGLELGGGSDNELKSDTAPLHGLCQAILDVCPDTHAMRDPTRGGLAATLVEIASRRGLDIEVDELAVPVHEDTRGACELLGLDPWLVANEGKLVAFVPEKDAARALHAMRSHPFGREAARIGTVTESTARASHLRGRDGRGSVVARTRFGSSRVIDLPLHELLPRIC